jgi:hypothetical protein
VDGPGLVDGGEELVPDVGDTRIGNIPAQPMHACGQDKLRKNRQEGQEDRKRYF